MEQFHFDNIQFEQLLDVYKDWYNKGMEPTAKTMLYHEDEFVRNTITSISMFPFELSTRWDEIMEGMKILNRDISVQDTIMSLNYFKLRKLKKMFDQNQQDMEHASFEDQIRLIELHKQLKEFERAITVQLGTVIIR